MNQKYSIAFTIIGVIILILFIWYFSNIVVYVLVAAILSVLGQPLVRLLDKIKIGKISIPRSISALITLLIMVMVFLGFIWFFVPLISNQAKVISQINVEEVMTHYQGEPINNIENFPDSI